MSALVSWGAFVLYKLIICACLIYHTTWYNSYSTTLPAMSVSNIGASIRRLNGSWKPRKTTKRTRHGTQADSIDLHDISTTNNEHRYHVVKPIQQDESAELPYFEVSLRMRNCCLVALSLTWVAGVAFLVAGIILLQKPRPLWVSRGVHVELATLAINICLTGLLEGNGFIHTTALRWALHLEGRLTFNSNLRLFTSSAASKPNSWYCNSIYAITTITAYASASLFFQKAYNKPGATIVHPASLLLLGCSLLAMAALVTWAYVGKDSVSLIKRCHD